MRLLLDTHIWVWSISESGYLKRSVAAELKDPANELWLSPISTWELFFLFERKRIRLEPEPATWVRETFKKVPYQEAVINHQVMLASHAVDLPHRDPADRILAATAMVYDLTLVTADEHLMHSKSFPVLPNR